MCHLAVAAVGTRRLSLGFQAAILNTVVTSRTWARARRLSSARLTFESLAFERGDASESPKCNSAVYIFAYVITNAK